MLKTLLTAATAALLGCIAGHTLTGTDEVFTTADTGKTVQLEAPVAKAATNPTSEVLR